VKATSTNYNLGLVLVICGVVAWSMSGLFTRLLSLDAPTILFWRGLFGAFGMFVLLLVWQQPNGILAAFKLGRSGLAYSVVTAISMVFFVSALKHTSVAHVAVITATVPFLAALLGWVILREVPHVSAVIASIAALVGVAIMVGVGTDGHIFGDILAALMALGMAGMILISRKYPSIPALSATCIASLLSAVFTLPFVSFAAATSQDIMVLVGFGLVNQVMGFGLFAVGARWLPPMETALITALEAPLAPFWVWLVLQEVPDHPTLLGGVIVMVAVVAHIVWENNKSSVR
jgi:drug/metabolite transporter (DMT)-like permease